MFRITEGPSSGSLVQCLGKNYKWFYRARCACVLHTHTHTHTHTQRAYAAIIPTLSMSTDTIGPFVIFSQALYKAP
jgi:hypothetical protein